jgi:hypothetical protein
MYRKRKHPVPDPFRIFVFMLFLPGMFTACTDDWVENQQFSIVDDSRIVERESYSLPAMPVIYLLDAGKRVILKDASLERLEAWLSENNILRKKYERPR